MKKFAKKSLITALTLAMAGMMLAGCGKSAEESAAAGAEQAAVPHVDRDQDLFSGMRGDGALS